MKLVITFKYRGWLGLCPIYISDLDAAIPCLPPRHWAASPVMDLFEVVSDLIAGVGMLFGRTWCLPILVTGPLDTPLTKTFEVEE